MTNSPPIPHTDDIDLLRAENAALRAENLALYARLNGATPSDDAEALERLSQLPPGAKDPVRQARIQEIQNTALRAEDLARILRDQIAQTSSDLCQARDHALEQGDATLADALDKIELRIANR